MANSRAVISMYDEPMWASIRAERMELQQCSSCKRFRYPPAPNCPHCPDSWSTEAGTFCSASSET
jgi:uncharacterized OB-fold protein